MAQGAVGGRSQKLGILDRNAKESGLRFWEEAGIFHCGLEAWKEPFGRDCSAFESSGAGVKNKHTSPCPRNQTKLWLRMNLKKVRLEINAMEAAAILSYDFRNRLYDQEQAILEGAVGETPDS
jgi:hypothetical protein